MSARAGLLSAVLLALFLAGSIAVLPDFGLAWDEALGDLFFGHRNLAALAGDRSALDFATHHPRDGDGQSHPDLFHAPLRDRPWEHAPVMATASAAACEILARRLGWLDPVDAHHLAGVLALALLVPFLVAAAERAWGFAGALGAGLALLLQPRLLAAAWTDLKDTGAAVFGTLALLGVARALVGGGGAAWLAAGAAAGLALGTKLNVLFLPLPLLVWWWLTRPGRPPAAARTALGIGLAAVVALAIAAASWPWLRAEPWPRLALHLGYVFGRGAGGGDWPNPWPGITLIASWPLGSLVLVALGAWAGISELRARRSGLSGLALLATLFPLARLSAPGVLSFDGYRHALELVPAAALLAGAGAARLMLLAKPGLARLALAAALLEPALEVAWSHPFGMAHASPLVGGISGARRLGLPGFEDYWATSYRRAWRWLDQHAEPGAAVAAGVAEHLLAIEGRWRLRPDLARIRASHPFQPDPGPEVAAAFLAAARERPVYLVYVHRPEWWGPLVRAADSRPALWREGPSGAALVRIVRIAPEDAPFRLDGW